MAKIAGFFVTKNTVFQMTIDIEFGIATLFEAEGDYWDRLEPPVYDLFDL